MGARMLSRGAPRLEHMTTEKLARDKSRMGCLVQLPSIKIWPRSRSCAAWMGVPASVKATTPAPSPEVQARGGGTMFSGCSKMPLAKIGDDGPSRRALRICHFGATSALALQTCGAWHSHMRCHMVSAASPQSSHRSDMSYPASAALDRAQMELHAHALMIPRSMGKKALERVAV